MKIIQEKDRDSENIFGLAVTAVNIVEDNLRSQFSLRDVTSQFEKSHWYFQRLFASVIGVTIGQYQRERQLTEASFMVRDTKDRILDIALEFGFGSEEAFSRSFKSFFGMTPSSFRKSSGLILRESRNRISKEKLEYFWQNVQRKPDIVECKEKILVGTSIEFKSHFILGSSCHMKIVPHWADFKKRMDQIPFRTTQERIGVTLTSELELREERLTYFSGVEVSSAAELLDQMHEVRLPKGLYACFENRTLSEKNGHLMDYIYGIWLPTSGFQRGLGFDYEIFDHRYLVGDPNSISRFFVPLAVK